MIETEVWASQVDSPPGDGEAEVQPLVYARYPYGQHVQVSWITNGVLQQPVTLRAVNIGPGGLTLVSRSRIRPGSRAAVLLPNGSGGLLRGIRIERCQYVGYFKQAIAARWVALPSTPPIRVEVVDGALWMSLDRRERSVP